VHGHALVDQAFNMADDDDLLALGSGLFHRILRQGKRIGKRQQDQDDTLAGHVHITPLKDSRFAAGFRSPRSRRRARFILSQYTGAARFILVSRPSPVNVVT